MCLKARELGVTCAWGFSKLLPNAYYLSMYNGGSPPDLFGFSSATSDMDSAPQVQPESPLFGGGGRKRKLVRHAFNAALHEAT
jgi:hypothetical protein